MPISTPTAAGDDATAAQHNSLVTDSRDNTMNMLLWCGSTGTELTKNCVITSLGRYLLYSSATQWNRLDALIRNVPYPDTANATAIAGLSITPDVATRYIDSVSGVEYIIAFADGGTAPFRYDLDGQNEAAISFSGTAVSTGATRIGFDPGDKKVYVTDAADKSGTAVRRYTITGTTATFVDTITLSAAPANAGHIQMFVGDNFLIIDDSASNTTADFHRYGKDSGTEQDNPSFGGVAPGRRGTLVQHPNKEWYMLFELDNSATMLMFMKWTMDDLSFT